MFDGSFPDYEEIPDEAMERKDSVSKFSYLRELKGTHSFSLEVDMIYSAREG
jgi:hypothetical protein